MSTKSGPFYSHVGSKYGAPMGRDTQPLPRGSKVHLVRVPLDSGGYDPGGAYWGIGLPLYCAWTGDDGEAYLRAGSRDEAKRILISKDPTLKFYR